MNYNFSVYIHSNKMNDLPSKVAKYSFEKHNPNLEVYIDYLEDHPKLLEYHNHTIYRGNTKLNWDSTKHQSFFPVRFLCAETHLKFNRNSKWILVVDPDIFCLKDLTILNSYIERAENQNKDFIAVNKLSSAMLLNTENITWTEESFIQDVFIKKNDFDNWMLLKPYGCVNLPKSFNEYDAIKPDTILLHTTKTETQPWKTGIKYKEWELHNKIPNPSSPTLTFKDHPNSKVKSTVFSLFEESFNNGLFTLNEIKTSIQNKALRPDITKVCNII